MANFLEALEQFKQQKSMERINHWEPNEVKLSNQYEQAWLPQVQHEWRQPVGQSSYQIPNEFEQGWTPPASRTWGEQNEYLMVPSLHEHCPPNFPPMFEDNQFTHVQNENFMRDMVLHMREIAEDCTVRIQRLQDDANFIAQELAQPPNFIHKTPSFNDLREVERKLAEKEKTMVTEQERKKHKLPVQEEEVPPPSIEKKKPSLEEMLLQFIKDEKHRRDKYYKREREFAEQLHHQNVCLNSIKAKVNQVVNVVLSLEARLCTNQEVSDEEQWWHEEVGPDGQVLEVKRVEQGELTKGECEVKDENIAKEVKEDEVVMKLDNIVARNTSKDPTSSNLTEPTKKSNEVTSNPSLANTSIIVPYATYGEKILYVEGVGISDGEDDFDVKKMKLLQEHDMALKVELKKAKSQNIKKKKKAKKEQARTRGNMFKEQLKVLDTKLDVLLDTQPTLKPVSNSHSICFVQSNPPLEGKDSLCRDEQKSEVYVPPHLKLQGVKKLEESVCNVDHGQQKNKGKKKKRKKKSFKENPT